MSIGNVCGVEHVLYRRVGVAVCDVIVYRVAEHHRLLLNVAYLLAVGGEVKVFDVVAVHQDLSRVAVVEAHQQIDEGGFTASRCANDTHNVAGLNGKGYVVEHLFGAVEGKSNVEKFYLTFEGVGNNVGLGVGFGLCLKNVEYFFG